MRYFVNKNRTAPFNIAMDEWLLTHLKPEAPVFTLWQNNNAVIVGKLMKKSTKQLSKKKTSKSSAVLQAVALFTMI